MKGEAEIRESKSRERTKLWRDLAKDLGQWASECPPGSKEEGLHLSREDQEKLGAILDGMVDEMQRFDALERTMAQATEGLPQVVAERTDPDDPDSQYLVCSMCRLETEERHTWKRCAEALKAQRDGNDELITQAAVKVREYAARMTDALSLWLPAKSEAPPDKTFDNADYYDCMNDEELHAMCVEDAISYMLDGRLDPGCDVAAEIARFGSVKVTAYRRKVVPRAELETVAESMVELFIERIGEEYGNPNGDPGDEFSLKDERRLVQAIVPLLGIAAREADLWACEPCGERTFTASEVEAMMREHNPDWFESDQFEGEPA